MVINIFWLIFIIAFQENRISYELKEGIYLDINLYEIRTEDNIIKNPNLLEAFLFDCQCALFLIDMSNYESLNPVKDIIYDINEDKYPFLKKIIVENKSDTTTGTPNDDLIQFLNDNPNLDHIVISIKNGNNLDNLWDKIYKAINPNTPYNNTLPINDIKKSTSRDYSVLDKHSKISLILLGDSMVGKTNFMLRYNRNNFQSIFLSTNSDIYMDYKKLKINNNDCLLAFWDTPGQERYRSIPQRYYQNADGILLLFDITDKKSFENIPTWISDINTHTGRKTEAKEGNDITLYLVGTKIDLLEKEEEIITKEEKENLAKQFGVKYYEVSCKWNLNIEEVMARIILDSYRCNRRKNRKESTLQLKRDSDTKDGSSNNRRGGCC